MWAREWVVLVVDDEPDVLEVSKLVMRNFDVYGLPLRIVTASSKAEAIELLNTTLTRANTMSVVSVAIIDVVMETDHAGLELCEYIRNTLNNREMQLYVRTGQPGVAPERSVVDSLEINGYYSKVEATEDKLYSMIKTGIKSSYSVYTSNMYVQLLSILAGYASTREHILQAFYGMGPAIRTTAANTEVDSESGSIGIIAEGQHIDAPVQIGADEAYQIRSELSAMTPLLRNEAGDYLVFDESNMRVLVHIEPRPGYAQFDVVGTGNFRPPDTWMHMTFSVGQAWSALWALSGRN